MGKRIWKSQTGERAPFWCTDMIFARDDFQCFMLPVIFHQAENYTHYLHWNLPSDWLFHNILSGYMGRYGWMKVLSLSNRTCGASKLNPQVLFFDVHKNHFDDRATHLLRSHHISPFILKAVNSTSNQPNDNGPNLKLKRYFSIEKLKFQGHHETNKFTPAHKNSVLVEMCHLFHQQSASVIIDALKIQSPSHLPT